MSLVRYLYEQSGMEPSKEDEDEVERKMVQPELRDFALFSDHGMEDGCASLRGVEVWLSSETAT